MRKLYLFILILLFVVVLAFPFGTVYSAVTMKNIVLNPAVVNTQSEVRIYFILGSSLASSGKIYVKFPAEFAIPDTINLNLIELGGVHPAGISIENKVVIITTTQAIFENQGSPDGFPLVFFQEAGIKTPSAPGTYTFEMWTSIETAHSYFDVFVGLSSSGSQISNLDVRLDDSTSWAGAETGYTISFRVSSEGVLMSTRNDFVDVYFPRGTILPDVINPEKAFFNIKSCDRIEREGRRLRVYVPENWTIFPFTISTIVFSKEFGIVNPEFTGKYAIQVSTSRDGGLAVSNLYSIFGTPILGLSIGLNPPSQMNLTEVKIKFKQQPVSSLVAEKSKINVKFSPDFVLPENVKPGAVTVNGTPCVRVNNDDHIISIYSPVNIAPIDDVEVVFKKEFGIVNPAEIGSYEIMVNTSSDAELVSYFITTRVTTISQVTIKLSNTSAGQVSSYLVSFKTGLNGKLLPGIDRINVVFPVGTTIPTIIATSQVLINGTPTTLIEISGTTVTVTPPFEINADSSVNIEFKEGAGLRNPVNSGNYLVYINTSKEKDAIASNSYSIRNVPAAVVSIEPNLPDGLSGFYRTKPRVSFEASSATDPNPSIFYYFDSNQPVLYQGSAISAPEGIHELFYYAVDKDGHREETKSIQLKVDTIPPVLTVLYPLNNSILNSSTVLVRGNVDAGSSVKVNGEAVQVDGLGNFETTVKLVSNPDVINISAIDIAGNASQIAITVSFDTVPPPLTVSRPVMFQQISKLPIVVEGKTEAGVSVSVNGSPATVSEDGSFTFSLQTLQEGTLTNIEVIATDTAGNSTKRTISVKYSKSVTLILQINNSFALINGQTYTLEAAPVISSGRTMVPLRFIGEAFGAEFEYEPISKSIDITYGSDRITMQIGNKTATVNGNIVELDVAPFIVNSRTLVPIRFISETFGAEVAWDSSTKTVTILYPKP